MKQIILACSLSVGSVQSLQASMQTETGPVAKVTRLLKDMLKQLDKEAEEDEEMYDKLACWCSTYDKEKTKAIGEADRNIDRLDNLIGQLSGQSAELTVQIKALKKEVAQNQMGLDEATAIRQKEYKEFAEEDKELSVAVAGLEQSIQVLVKQGRVSFLQISSGHAAFVKNVMQKSLQRKTLFLTQRQKKVATAFLQQGESTQHTGDTIGVLQAMLTSFSDNLKKAQQEEAEDVAQYEALKRAKEEEIQAGQNQIDQKTMELANTDEKMAESMEDLADSKKTLEADKEFLAMLKNKCSSTDEEWTVRQKTRQTEIEACSKALAVLSSDDAQRLFTSTFDPSFLQLKMSATRRSEASRVLSGVAQKMHNPRLAALSVRVKMDTFDRVKAAIDEMVSQLTVEQQDEVKHKDFCVTEMNSNQVENERTEREKQTALASVDDLDLAIKTYASEIGVLKSDMDEMRLEMKRGGEDREKENLEFQQVVSDQRASIRLLNAALEILKGFYDKSSSFSQQNAAAWDQQPAAPSGFKEYKDNAASGGVLRMIDGIIADAKRLEADTIRAEEDAQKSYETFVKDTNMNLGVKSQELVNKSEEKAKAEEDLNQATMDRDNSMLLLEQLSNRKATLHQSCDFILNNFDLRQGSRTEEINALKQAKGILSGSQFSALLQSS